jgi:hypothetical protein
MANTIISPNMNLPVPVVGTDPGPDWATNINACMSGIDSHNHSSGQGVQITPTGMNINADLAFNANNLTSVNAVLFQQIGAALTALLRSLQVVDKDLYYVDGDSNAVRITQSGSVTGATGTITGLPSGTASAAYAAGVFTFQAATNTPATMNVGPIVTGASVAGAKTVTISASASQPANYDLTWPLAAPQANQVPISDGSGNLSWSWGLMPIGSVIATFPNLTGAYSTVATTAADAYGFVKCEGQTIADATSPMNGQVVPNINNSIFLMGSMTAGTSGGAATSSGLGAHTHTFTSSTSVAAAGHRHNFSHVHQWGHNSTDDASGLTSKSNQDSSSTFIGTGSQGFFNELQAFSSVLSAGANRVALIRSSDTDLYTTGVLSGPSGTGSSANTGTESADTTVAGTTDSTGTSFSIVPPYISAVYLMRIK